MLSAPPSAVEFGHLELEHRAYTLAVLTDSADAACPQVTVGGALLCSSFRCSDL